MEYTAFQIALGYRAQLDFMVNRFLMKLFNSNDMQTIEFYRLQFNFKLPSEQIGYRRKKFASSEFVISL